MKSRSPGYWDYLRRQDSGSLCQLPHSSLRFESQSIRTSWRCSPTLTRTWLRPARPHPRFVALRFEPRKRKPGRSQERRAPESPPLKPQREIECFRVGLLRIVLSIFDCSWVSLSLQLIRHDRAARYGCNRLIIRTRDKECDNSIERPRIRSIHNYLAGWNLSAAAVHKRIPTIDFNREIHSGSGALLRRSERPRSKRLGTDGWRGRSRQSTKIHACVCQVVDDGVLNGLCCCGSGLCTVRAALFNGEARTLARRVVEF